MKNNGRIGMEVSALLLAAMIAGCSGAKHAANPAVAAPTDTPTAASGGSGKPQVLAKVTASRELFGSNGNKVRLDIRGLHRRGQVTMLSYSVENIGTGTVNGGNYVGYSEFYLLDLAGMKRYSVVKAADGQRVDRLPGSISPGATEEGWAYFPTPPPEVKVLDLIAADAGTFESTPVT